MYRLYVTQQNSLNQGWANQTNTELFPNISAKGINHVIDKYNELTSPEENDQFFIWNLRNKSIRLDIIDNDTNKLISANEFMCLNP